MSKELHFYRTRWKHFPRNTGSHLSHNGNWASTVQPKEGAREVTDTGLFVGHESLPEQAQPQGGSDGHFNTVDEKWLSKGDNEGPFIDLM